MVINSGFLASGKVLANLDFLASDKVLLVDIKYLSIFTVKFIKQMMKLRRRSLKKVYTTLY